LRAHHFIKSGDHYFKPAEGADAQIFIVRLRKGVDPTAKLQNALSAAWACCRCRRRYKRKPLKVLKAPLPAYLRNLTDPYELSDTLMWWETIECLRKMVLVGLFIFIAYGTVEQLVGGIVTSLVFTVLYNNFKPYDSWENDLLQQVCQLALFFMLLAALMLRYEEAVSTDEAWSPKDDEDLGWALLIVTSLIPLLAFFMTAIYDRRLLFDRARRVWRTLKRMRYPSFYIDAAKKSADSSLSFVRKAKTLAWVTSTVLAPLLSEYVRERWNTFAICGTILIFLIVALTSGIVTSIVAFELRHPAANSTDKAWSLKNDEDLMHGLIGALAIPVISLCVIMCALVHRYWPFQMAGDLSWFLARVSSVPSKCWDMSRRWISVSCYARKCTRSSFEAFALFIATPTVAFGIATPTVALVFLHQEANFAIKVWSPKDDVDLSWVLLIVASLVPMLAFAGYALIHRWTTSGLKWEEAGRERPTTGAELTNDKLRLALKSKIEFTQGEWDSFGVKNLRAHHFVKSGDRYFKPAGIRYGTSTSFISTIWQTLDSSFPLRLRSRIQVRFVKRLGVRKKHELST